MTRRTRRPTFLGTLIHNTAIGFAGTLGLKGLTFATTLTLARGLGAEGFGLYSYVCAYMFFFVFISELGMAQVITREVSRSPDRAAALMGNALSLKLALSVVAFAAAVGVSYLLELSTEVRFCIFVAALGLPLSVVLIFRGHLQTRYEMKYSFGVTLPSNVALLLAAIVTVRLHLPVHVLFYAALGIGLCTLCGFLWVARSRVRISLRAQWNEMALLLRNSFEVGLFGLLLAMSMRVDQVMLFYFRGASDVGLYAAVVRISEALSVVPDALLLTVFPLLASTEHTAPERFQHTYRLGFKYLAAFIMPIALVLTFLRQEVTRVVFGPTYVAAADALAILAWNMFFGYTGAVYLNLFIAQARQRLLLVVSVLAVVVNVLCNLAWIPAYGASGAATATLIANVAGFLCWCVAPATRPYMFVCISEAWRPALAAAAVVAPVWLLALGAHASLLAVVVIYPAVLWALGGVTWTDVALVQRLFTQPEAPPAL